MRNVAKSTHEENTTDIGIVNRPVDNVWPYRVVIEKIDIYEIAAQPEECVTEIMPQRNLVSFKVTNSSADEP